MANPSPKLEWCIVRLGEDLNWWVEEISDNVHWDVDGLSIIDPRQLNHIMDLIEPLRDYDFQTEVLTSAFYTFKIEKALGENQLRLTRCNENLLESEEPLFVLPDIIDEEKGPFADLIDHLSALRVKLLNDSIEFEQKLTVDELEDEIREEQNQDFMEGRATHTFVEMNAILEYVPAGYELDEDPEEKVEKAPEDSIEDEFPDIDDEKIEEDETMKWDDDEEKDGEESEEGEMSEGEEEEPEEEAEKPKRGRPRKSE